MERAEERTSSTPYGGGRVGGKVRKPTSRKPPPTPYARPEQNQSQRRWLSKLVDPAYRLITGGATRLLPYLFSKSLPSIALPSPGDEDQDQVEAKLEDNVSGEEPRNVNEVTSTLAGLPAPSREAHRPENNSDFNGCQKDREKDALAGNGKFDVEEWIQRKTFSRDEVSRLLEIIKSRALEPSNKVEDNKISLQSDGKPSEQPSAANRVLKMPREEKQEDLDKAMWGNLTPLPHPSEKLNEVGASPVDIARAYMNNRKFEPGLLSDEIPDDERALLHGDHRMSKPFTPSMSPNPSICWPGAMSESQCSYLTPRSQRGRFGLHNFPRTPYSRSNFSKSKSKLTQVQGDTQKFVNTPPLWQQSRIPAYTQMTSNNYEPLDEATGSIGPIRRLQHKASAVTNSKRSAYFYPTRQAETKVDNSNISERILPDKKNLELGGASTIPLSHSVGFNNSESSLLTVRPESSQVARSMLEHISRNPPTPKEKTEELKRAIEWKKTQSSNVQMVKPIETSSLNVELDSRQKANQVDQNRHSQMSDKRKTMSTVHSEENAGINSDAVNKNSPDLKFRLSNADWKHKKHKDDAGLKINNLSPKDVSPKIVSALGSEVGTQIKPFPSIGTKPGFPSITTNKPEPKWPFSSDSGSAFTFPVSGASSGGLSEPPTPSIFPSTNLGGSQSLFLKPESAVPSYRFGSKKSNPAIVFSFPSTNGDTIHTDASNIKFSFGSDDHTRLSFSSVGKDAVCC